MLSKYILINQENNGISQSDMYRNGRKKLKKSDSRENNRESERNQQSKMHFSSTHPSEKPISFEKQLSTDKQTQNSNINEKQTQNSNITDKQTQNTNSMVTRFNSKKQIQEVNSTQNQSNSKNSSGKHASFEKQLLKDRYLDKAQTPLVNMCYKDALPFVTIFSANENLSKSLYHSLTLKLASYSPKSDLLTMNLFNKKMTLFRANNDLETMIDISKLSDLLILVVSSEYFDMEFFEMSSLLKATGLCKVIVCVKFHNDRHRMYSRIRRRVWKEFCNGLPVVDFDNVDKIAKLIKHMKYRPLSFKCNNSYIVVDRVVSGRLYDTSLQFDVNTGAEQSFEAKRFSESKDSQKSNQGLNNYLGINMKPLDIKTVICPNAQQFLEVEDSQKNSLNTFNTNRGPNNSNNLMKYEMCGYVRGCPFEADYIHIPGEGDFYLESISKLPDPCISEKKLLDKNKTVVYEPVFISNIHSHIEEQQKSFETTEDDSSDIEIFQGMKNSFSIQEDKKFMSIQEDTNLSGVHEDKNLFGLQEDEKFSGIQEDTNISEVHKEKGDAKLFQDFKNTLKNQTDTIENHLVSNEALSKTNSLPNNISSDFIETKTHQYNPNQTQSLRDKILVLKNKLKPHFTKDPSTTADYVEKFNNEHNISSKNPNTPLQNPLFQNKKGLIPGTYVKITFQAHSIKSKKLLIAAAIKTQKKVMLQGKIKKNNFFEGTLKSSDELLISIGWYRYYARTVFSIKDTVRNRFLKYILNGMFCNASFYGNTTLPGTPFCLIKNFKIKKISPKSGIQELNNDSRASYNEDSNENSDHTQSNEQHELSVNDNLDTTQSGQMNELSVNDNLDTTQSGQLNGLSVNDNLKLDEYTETQKLFTNSNIHSTVKLSKDHTPHSSDVEKPENLSMNSNIHSTVKLSKDHILHSSDGEKLQRDHILHSDEENDSLEILSSFRPNTKNKKYNNTNLPKIDSNHRYNSQKYISTEHFRIAAFGTVQDTSGAVDILKKIKIIGYPYKIHENTAFIKDMFTSEREAVKFENSLIKTVSNIRGIIKKGLKDGCVRCSFEARISMSDIVFLRCFVKYDLTAFMQSSVFPMQRFEFGQNYVQEKGGGSDFHESDEDSKDDTFLQKRRRALPEENKNFRDSKDGSMKRKAFSDDNKNFRDSEDGFLKKRAFLEEERKNSKILKKIQDLKSKLTLNKQQIDFAEKDIDIPLNPEERKIKNFQEQVKNLREIQNKQKYTESLSKDLETRKTAILEQKNKKERLLKNIVVSQIEKKMKKGKRMRSRHK